MESCVFCKIVSGDLPATFIYKDDNVVVFKNIAPVATHHYLVIPVKHVDNFMEAKDEILAMTKASQRVIKDLHMEDAYKLVFNGGIYQSVPHLHWHLLAGKLESDKDLLNHL